MFCKCVPVCVRAIERVRVPLHVSVFILALATLITSRYQKRGLKDNYKRESERERQGVPASTNQMFTAKP